MSKPFDVEVNNSIAHIRFNRPEKRNSMNEDFWNLFPKEVEGLDDSGEIIDLHHAEIGNRKCRTRVFFRL